MVELWKDIIFESLLVKKIIEYYEEKEKEEKAKKREETENAEIKK